jgi:integrase
MPTAKALLDTRYKSKDNTYPVIIRCRHQGKTRDMATGWKIDKKYWAGEQVSGRHPDAVIINGRISDLLNQAKQYYATCQLQGRAVKLDLIGSQRNSYSFNAYLLHRAKQFDEKEMIIMGRKTRRLEKEIKLCFSREIFFEDITADLLRDLEAWMVQQDNINNTRHKKFKFLGFYSQAVTDGKATDPNPFKQYKIKRKPVQKEKLTPEEIKAIEDLQLNPGPVNNARNLFLFSYYCKGVRFADCITCGRDHVVNGRIIFETGKTGKFISIKIHQRLQAILDIYKGDYLFPYIKTWPDKKIERLKIIDSLNVVVNRNLKVVAGLSGIKKDLTFHIARHTFASHLKGVTDNINAIQESLGHSDQRTTALYLQALDDEKLDKEMDKLYGK